MNKMMIAVAACALSGVATAGNICVIEPGPGPDPVKFAQRVYDFKASVKCVDAKTATVKATYGKDCFGNKVLNSAQSLEVYRVKSSRTFKGVIIDCDVCEIENNGAKVGDSLALAQKADNPPIFAVASSANKYKYIYEAAAYGETAYPSYEVGLLNWIGGPTFAKAKVAEMTAAFWFTELDKQLAHERAWAFLAAGFGTRDGDLLKSVSGNIVGESTVPFYCGLFAQAFEPCTEKPYYTWGVDADDKPVQNPTTWALARSPAYDAAYGTWSLKYSASKTNLGTQNEVYTKTFGKGWTVMDGVTPMALPVQLDPSAPVPYGAFVGAYPFTVTFN